MFTPKKNLVVNSPDPYDSSRGVVTNGQWGGYNTA